MVENVPSCHHEKRVLDHLVIGVRVGWLGMGWSGVGWGYQRYLPKLFKELAKLEQFTALHSLTFSKHLQIDL
ncbi:hypothetical protein M0804_010021 [Polistes exclamans]|nr:hypothetical protein M0804_010021 [Polistes exclamans]